MLNPKLQDDFTFTGSAKIEAVVEHPTNNITLHVGNIKIESVNILIYEPSPNFLISYNNITEQYTITLPKTLEKDKELSISFTYNGTLSDNMIGFYRSSYFDEKGQIK